MTFIQLQHWRRWTLISYNLPSWAARNLSNMCQLNSRNEGLIQRHWDHWESFYGFYRFGNSLLINVNPQSCNYTLAYVCLHRSNVSSAAGQYFRSLSENLWLIQNFMVTKRLVKTLWGSKRGPCLRPSFPVHGRAGSFALLGCLRQVQNGTLHFIKHPVPLQLAAKLEVSFNLTCSVINVSAYSPYCWLRLAKNVWAFQSCRCSNTFCLPHLSHM